jgi:hypothetical protein
MLLDAAMVVDAVQYAKTSGLDVEFMLTFLEHHASNQYTVAECIGHAMREWDL